VCSNFFFTLLAVTLSREKPRSGQMERSRVVVHGTATITVGHTITAGDVDKTTRYAPSEKTRVKGAVAVAPAASFSSDRVRRAKLAENARWHSLCPRGVGKTLAVEAFVKKYIEIKEAVRHRGPRGGPRHPFTPLEDFALVSGILDQGPAAYEDTQVRVRRFRSCGFPRHEPSLLNCSSCIGTFALSRWLL